MSVEYNPLPPRQWSQEAPNGDVHLCDAVDGQPLRGYGFDREPNRPPMRFEEDTYGYREGRRFWEGADEESNQEVEVHILLTDPSRPDGLGKPGVFEQVAQQYDIVGHTAVRGAVFAARQHGLGDRAPGLYLDDNTSHDEYKGRLENALQRLGTPNFSFTPSIRSGLMVPIARSLQRGRKAVYDLLGEQEDLQRPDLATYAADMAHTNELGHAMLGEAGIKLRDYIDHDVDKGGHTKPFPERILLVAAGEHGNLQEYVEDAMGVPSDDNIVKTGLTLPEAMQEGSDIYWYVQAKSMGYIPKGQIR
jgi:hypothetical protein